MNQKLFIRDLEEVVRKHGPDATQLRYALKVVRENLSLQVKKRPKKAPRRLTAPEMYALLRAATGLDNATALLVHLALATGLRVSEIRSLDLRDFDVDNNSLQVTAGKGAKDRVVPFTLSLWRQIRAFVGERTSGPIFLANGRPVSKRSLQRWVKNAGREAGLGERVSPHVLRHTYAYMMISKGMPAESLQMIMGHEEIQTTQLYFRTAIPEDTKNKYLQIAEGL